ncbi:predicted protein [Streptomyces albidoflavus]|nr:predicted protein [Streptomyces albidoflavus]
MAKPCPMEESAEAPRQVGGVERADGRGGEDEGVVRADRSCGLTFFLLVFPVALERVDALDGKAMRRSEARVLVSRVVRPCVRVRWSERRMLAVPLSGLRPFRCRPRSSPLPEAGAQGSDPCGAQRFLRSGQRCAAARPRGTELLQGRLEVRVNAGAPSAGC